jgi:CelD/BcsL family acetyltransferase involved in cellulose biosynthesis
MASSHLTEYSRQDACVSEQAVLNKPYTVEQISTDDALGGIKADWDRLSRSITPNVFTSYDWVRAWYTQFAKDRVLRPNVLVLRRDGVVCGIAPLVASITRKFGVSLKRLHFAWQSYAWDYNDLVVGDDLSGQIAAVAQYLLRDTQTWDYIDLRELRDTGAIAHIETALTEAGLSFRTFPEEARCPYMPINGSWEEAMLQRSRFTRREFRRFKQRAGEGFRTRVVEDPSKEPELLERMINVEAQKHVGGKLSTPFLGRYVEVFKSLFEALGPKGWISVVVLECKDRLVAWQLLYRCGKKLWGYMTAYDHAYADLSPGTILISAVIDYGHANGFDEFDFLKGEEAYKLRWATDFHRNYRMVIWNRRWSSRLHAYRSLRAIKSELRLVPPQARTEHRPLRRRGRAREAPQW